MTKCYVLAVVLSVFPLILVPSSVLANPGPEVFWFDDIEGDVSEWGSIDFTAGAAPHFHLDSYMVYEGEDSWWCGSFDYDTDGGYGNGWDDRLSLPPINVNPVVVDNLSWGAIKAMYRDDAPENGPARTRDPVFPVLTFAYRHDSEVGYDYTYVQAESSGVFVNLNRGYDGRQPWTDIGPYGFDLSDYDDPLNVRFRFLSDGAWSDEDGLYFSVGGGFAVDNIKVYDFSTGEVLFYDDAESGSIGCMPGVPGAAGDFWHVIDRMCPALSDPHSWWCGTDSDTSLVPPNLQNGLYSPLVDIHGTYACTVRFAMHFAIPTVDNDYVSFLGTANGSDYYGIAAYWGDFGSCDGWGGGAYNTGYDILQFQSPPYTWGGFLWVMNTTDNGCGPAGGGDAGVMLDDVFFTSGGNLYGLPGTGANVDRRPATPVKLLQAERYGRHF
jgi:hypothetical protein